VQQAIPLWSGKSFVVTGASGFAGIRFFYAYRWGTKRMNRSNALYLVIAGLVVVVGVLSYQLYQAKKEPTGVQLNIGERGISIEKK